MRLGRSRRPVAFDVVAGDGNLALDRKSKLCRHEDSRPILPGSRSPRADSRKLRKDLQNPQGMAELSTVIADGGPRNAEDPERNADCVKSVTPARAGGSGARTGTDS